MVVCNVVLMMTERGEKNLKDKLKKGQAFVGVDDQKYYFLGYDYEDQIMFTNLDLWSDREQKYIVKSNLFIKDILEETSEVIEDCTWHYQSLKEFEDSPTEEKLKRCFDIIRNSNTQELVLKPIEIGPLVRGQAYSKESNQFYEVVGFIIENDVYIDKQLKARQKGFFAIYHSNCEESVPLIFERNYGREDNSFDGKHFVACNDDKVDVLETIMSKEIVNSYLTIYFNKRINKKFYDSRTL